jgi:hypothetical protein
VAARRQMVGQGPGKNVAILGDQDSHRNRRDRP